MFSNWAGLSGWKTTEDPTGVLDGRVLIVSGELDNATSDLLIQEVGTSSSFDIKHYEVIANYAFQADWQFNSGLFGLVSRASYTGTDLTYYYFGGLDVQNKKIVILKYNGADFIVLAKAKLNKDYIRKEKIHQITFRTSGTVAVSLELEIDGEIALTASDVSNTRIESGYPGISVQRGTLYVDSFYVNRYTSDGKEPSEWTPSQLGANLSLWLSSSGKTQITVDSKNYISAWSDLSGKGNNASGAADQRPTYVPSWRNNIEGGDWEIRESGSRTTSFYTGPQNYGGANGGYSVSKTIGVGTDFTVAFWVYGTENVSQDLFGFVDPTATPSKVFWFRVTTAQFEVHAESSTSGKTNDLFYDTKDASDLVGGWHLIVVTYTGTQSDLGANIKFYLDGNEISVSSSNIRNPTDGTYYGGQKAGTHFIINSNIATSLGGSGIQKGYLADVTYWDKVLDSDDVTELYNSGNYLDPTTHSESADLDDWWKFEETETHPRYRPNNVYVPDLKGSANLTNNEWWTYMKETPTGGSSPIAGTGNSYYFGTNYIPKIVAEAPTGGDGSFYFGNISGASASTKRYLESATNYILNNGESITLAFWIRINGAALSSVPRLFTARNSGGEVFYLEIDTDSPTTPEFRIYARSDSYTSSPGDIYCQLEYDDDAISSGSTAWYHIVMTWNGNAHDLNTAIKLYVNSTLQATSSTTIQNPASTVNYPLGSISEFLFCAGNKSGANEINVFNMYSIATFDRVLSAAEVSTLYNSGNVLDPSSVGFTPSSNLTHFWRFVHKDSKNRLLDDNCSIANAKTPASNLFQINGYLKDDIEDESWNCNNQSFTTTQSGPSGGGTAASLLTVADATTLDTFGVGVSIFVIMYSSSQPEGGLSQIVIKKGNSYGLIVKENKLRFYNGVETGGASKLKFGTGTLSLMEAITNNYLYINGSKALSLSGQNPSADNTTALSLGAEISASVSTTLVGGIGEVVVYKGEMSDGDRQKVEGFLAHKWGITSLLPSDHPYITDTPKLGD